MLEAINKVRELQGEHGALRKRELLRKYKDDDNFCKLLYYALNPMLTYKISESTLRRRTQYDPKITLTMCDIFDVCETLSKRKALDDVTIYQVTSFLSCLETEEAEFYIELLSKTLRLGVTAKTVNKEIHGLIPEWEVQQSFPIDRYPIPDGTWFSLTQKLNGVRATCYKGKLYARSGVSFDSLDHIINEFSHDILDEFVFDGELTLRNKDTLSDNEAFRIATGLVNSDSVDKTAICYTIFDVIPAVEFEQGESKDTYRQRREALDAVQTMLRKDSPVSILPVLYSGADQSMIETLLNKMVEEDKEGLIVNLDTPYYRKRHNGILKVKRFYTMDLPIISCEEGAGRLAGILGAFVLQYKGNEVRVGTGFTNEQRISFWDNRDALIGTLCEVKYKEISCDKNTGAESLQFPVFISLRTDKTEVSFG